MELQPHEIGNLRALRDGETHAAFGAEMMGIAGLEDTAKILKGAIAVERDRLLATPHDFSSPTGLRRTETSKSTPKSKPKTSSLGPTRRQNYEGP